jgi:tetratricopeptide (TPR) repeat protein
MAAVDEETTPVKARIMIVGFDPRLQQMGAKHLREQGYGIRHVAAGSRVASQYEASPADVVILDAQRPDEAFPIIEAIQEVHDTAQFVLLTSPASEPEIVAKKSEYGVQYHLVYPFEAERLERIVEAVLSGEELGEHPAASAEPSLGADEIGIDLGEEIEPAAQAQGRIPEIDLAGVDDDALELAAPHEMLDEVAQTEGRLLEIWRKDSADVPASGSLAGYRLADVLHWCAVHRKTGILTLERGEHEKKFYIEQGTPGYVQSSLQHETLGAYLLKREVITPATHQISIAEMKRTGQRHAEILVDMGALEPDDAYRHLRDHIQYKAVAAFGWTDGSYRFDEHPKLPQEVMALRMNPCYLVVQGLRAYFDPRHLPLEFPALDNVVARRHDQPAYGESDLALSKTSARALNDLEEGMSAQAIAQATGSTLEQVMGIAYALYVLQVIELIDRPGDPGTPGPPVEDYSGPISVDEADLVTLDPQAQAFMSSYLRMRSADCFQLLGVGPEATDAEVAAAFEGLRRRFHPSTFDPDAVIDVRGRIDELWTRIELARQAIATEQGRRQYQQSLAQGAAASESSTRLPRTDALTAEEHFQAGEEALTREHHTEAVAAFGRALEAAPKEPAYLCHHGWALFLDDRAGARDQAIVELQRALSLDPSCLAGHLFLGRIHMLDGDDESALTHFEAAIRIDRRDVEARRYLHAVRSRIAKKATAEADPTVGGKLRRLLRRD